MIAVLRRSLPRPAPPQTAVYLALLDRRLTALAALAAGAPGALPASGGGVARVFLKRLEGTWDDGDENLVRGYLDRWVTGDPARALAKSLTEAADALARMQARPTTLWFFLWEMESVLAGGAT